MTYEPGYGAQPYPPFGADRSPVPDVSQPVSGFPPPAEGFAPMSVPPMSGPPVPTPPISGPPTSGPPVSPPYGPPPMIPVYQHPGGLVRPTVVTVAVTLTFMGIALAFVGTLLSHLAMADLAAHNATAEVRETLGAVSGFSTFMLAGVNLVAAVGTSICAISVMRGSNGGRITLCLLSGLFAGWKLMCGGYEVIAQSQSPIQEVLTQFDDAARFLYAAFAVDFFLMVVALVVLILLVTGTASQYFRAPRVAAGMPY